jgi:hypothetical protein
MGEVDGREGGWVRGRDGGLLGGRAVVGVLEDACIDESQFLVASGADEGAFIYPSVALQMGWEGNGFA